MRYVCARLQKSAKKPQQWVRYVSRDGKCHVGSDSRLSRCTLSLAQAGGLPGAAELKGRDGGDWRIDHFNRLVDEST